MNEPRSGTGPDGTGASDPIARAVRAMGEGPLTEEKLRARLMARAEKRAGRDRALAHLSDVTMAAHEAVIGRAAMAVTPPACGRGHGGAPRRRTPCRGGGRS